MYNSPALHPQLKVHFSYALKGEYLAVYTSDTYLMIPISHEIIICLATQRSPVCPYHCSLSIRKIEWCVYAVFMKNHKLITMHCLVKFHTQCVNLAISLGRYILAVSTLAPECIKICHLEETYLETNVSS